MQWYIPITIIPGVALLVLSTSNFIIALGAEIIKWTAVERRNDAIIEKNISQIGLLSRAIVSFYISLASFTLSGIFLGLFSSRETLNEAISTFLVLLGMASLLFGISLLIIYAGRAVRIREQQFEKFLEIN